jgi:hypothetical protein
MTATPVLAAGLAGHIADLRAKVACAGEWADDLYERRRLAEEWDPGLRDVYGSQDIAVEEADMAAADLRRELAALEAQPNGSAAMTRCEGD